MKYFEFFEVNVKKCVTMISVNSCESYSDPRFLPLDYLASEGTRAGEKLLDLLTVGVKDLSGRDVTPDYTGELNHVHALLTNVHEQYARAARQADLHKLRLQQNIQLLTCQRDVKQVLRTTCQIWIYYFLTLILGV